MKRRLGSYQTSSPFRDYEVLYISKSFEYSTLVESKIEDLFGKYKVKGNEEYEWYKLSKNQLTEVIKILDETNEGYSGEKYFE